MSFENAYIYTRKFEGGYVNDPDDSGGETFCGISRASWPRWAGWDLIDQAKRKVGPSRINRYLANDGEMVVMVETFFYVNFWLPVEALTLPERLTEKLFDTAVNCGFQPAIKILQRAVNRLEPVRKLKVDGRCGPLTKAAVWEMFDRFGLDNYLLEAFGHEQALRYKRLAQRPGQAKFLAAWLRRAAWMPEPRR